MVIINNLLVGIIGPSGGGKSTIINKILNKYPQECCRISTYTTREPRPGEKKGEQYNFITKQQYEQLYNSKNLIACSKVNGEYYGAPKINMKSQKFRDKVVLLDMGAKGAKEFKDTYKNSIFIYIIPPNEEILSAQMKNRDSTRMDRNRNQLKNMKDVCKWLVINDDIDKTVEEIMKIIKTIQQYYGNLNKIDKDTAKFLYQRTLYNMDNIMFLKNYYDKTTSRKTLVSENICGER